MAGTEKSGTTSVYQYLGAHPDVAPSGRKETDYFRSPSPHSQSAYEALFPGAEPGMLRMEASPGYLAESHLAAPAIASLIPDAKLLFILRDPIDRLLSSFEFHKSRFFIPEDLSFDAYIDLCARFERGEIGP
ncbi:MAG TPA: sulfotransferase, partial [Anaerolineales bacterium]|nr:sulfotransferase [Anaerolineales bacterium]